MIFLSHSSAEKPFVRFIGEELAACGYQYWLDAKDLEIGDPITPTIGQAISDSLWVVVFLSPDSIKSRWVRNELEAASRLEQDDAGRRLVPCLISGLTVDDLPPSLSDRLCANLCDPKMYATEMGRVLRRLGGGGLKRRNLPPLDAHRSGHLVRLCTNAVIHDWVAGWLFGTLAQMADATERYWGYVTLGRLGGGSARSFLHTRSQCEEGIALTGLQDALAIIDDTEHFLS